MVGTPVGGGSVGDRVGDGLGVVVGTGCDGWLLSTSGRRWCVDGVGV